MRILLTILLLLTGGWLCSCTAASSGYDIEAWFWSDHLSSRENIYVQDFDLPQPPSIPAFLSNSDFAFLDSAASQSGFWDLPDTIIGQSRGSLSPSPGTTRISFQTPLHHKTVEVLSWPIDREIAKQLGAMEDAIQAVVRRQRYYKSLPAAMLRG